MSNAARALHRLEPGGFFKTTDGHAWLLTDMTSSRWSVVPVDDVGEMGQVLSIIPPTSCVILDTAWIHDELLERLYELCLKTEPGSQEGELNGDDFSGASSKSPSIIVQKKTFRRRFMPKPPFTSFLLRLFGADFVAKFFISLETLGGFYPAQTEHFSPPEDTWLSGAWVTRGMTNDYDDLCKATTFSERYPMVTGTIPNLDAYQDQSRPGTIVPHLRRIKNNAVLSRIAKKAKLGAVRQAATQVLQERMQPRKRHR